MARTVFTGLPAAACVALSLAGCQLALPDGEAARADGGLALISTSPRVVERDVEAPQVFDMADSGLWDGRPSLGGVWVAHPQARDPERVIIRNPQTGASVVGALFRRERDNPGPRFQISSEAASALGILAGAPTQVRVTALRLERVEVAPAPAPATERAIAPNPSAAAAQSDLPVQPAAPAAAASSVADAAPVAARPDASPRPDTLIQVTGLDDSPEPDAAPAPRWRLADLFRRSAPEPQPLVELAAVAVPAALPDGASAVAPGTGAALAAPSGLDRPFVQIGIFSVESNATNARTQMQQAGLPVDIRRGRAGEREFWRVIVGPAPDAQGRARMLQQVRGMGFADAYAVAR